MSHTAYCMETHPSPISRARMRREANERARYASGHASMTTVGGGLFVSPSAVQARLEALDTSWQMLARDAQAISPPTVAQAPVLGAFASDLGSWTSFYDANHGGFTNWLMASSIGNQLDSWQQRVSDWQTKLTAVGIASSGPAVPSPPPNEPIFGSVGTAGMLQGIGHVAMWAAIIVGGVLVLVIVKEIIGVTAGAKALTA